MEKEAWTSCWLFPWYGQGTRNWKFSFDKSFHSWKQNNFILIGVYKIENIHDLIILWNQFYPPPKISNWIPTKIRNLIFANITLNSYLSPFTRKQTLKYTQNTDQNFDNEPWPWILNPNPESRPWIPTLNPNPESPPWILTLNSDSES